MNRELFLAAYNTLCHCTAYVLILSGGIRLRRSGILLVTLGLLVPSLCFMSLVDYYQFLYPAVLALVFRRREGGYLRALYKTFGGIFVAWLAIVVGYCLVSFAAPGWVGGVSYNLFMGLWVLACGMVVRLQWQRWQRLLQAGRSAGFLLAIQVLVIGFFQLIYPRIYYADQRGPRQVAAVMLTLLLLWMMLAWLVSRARDVEHRAALLQLELDQRQRTEREIQQRFKTTIALRHHYDAVLSTMGVYLRDGAYPELEAYFRGHVAPIYNAAQVDRESLGRIGDELLRGLIDTTLAEVSATMPNVRLAVQITGEITYPPGIRIQVFQLCSIYLENAVNSLRTQEEGWLEIALDGDAGQVVIQVVNSVPAEFRFQQMTREPDGAHGYGLQLIREIVERIPQFETFTRVEVSAFHQQLVIHREG